MGCGEKRAEAPRLPSFLGARLATQADAVAAAYDAGDPCEARRRALTLQATALKAINSGLVPAALQEPLQSSVNGLAGRSACVQPPPPPPAATTTQPEPGPPRKGHGKKHRKHKKKHGDEGGDGE